MVGFRFMAGDLGFEPRHTESESAVLPLHKSPMHCYYTLKKCACQVLIFKNHNCFILHICACFGIMKITINKKEQT